MITPEAIGVKKSMSRKALSRKEKETLYLRRYRELHRIWGSPDDFTDRMHQDYIDKWTEEELDREVAERVSQVRMEKLKMQVKAFFIGIPVMFVLLGVLGLLIFGIKQLMLIGK